MSATYDEADDHDEFAWRRPAPLARRAAMAVYSWQDPGWTFLLAVAASVPFILAALFAPALLSLSPTVDMIAPIAEARAARAGEAAFAAQEAPFYLFLLMAADLFADAPGRIHLIAKALSALLVIYPVAYFTSSRLPTLQGVLLTAALAAYVASPFSGPAELALALFLACALCFVSGSADNAAGRARFEGVIAGACLFILWLLHPVFSLAGFLALSACPFLSGRCGLTRYAATLAVFAALAALSEYFLPGVNVARASAATGVLNIDTALSGRDSVMGLSAIAVSTVVTLTAAVIFGGVEHVKGWAPAAGLVLVAFVAARAADANAMPVFVLACAIAVFSVASPFYDGLFRNHDRASVSIALSAAVLTLFWTGVIAAHAAGQFSLQYKAAQSAPEDIRAQLALVQPGGPTITQWIEEGRFSTPEAREFLALTPVDQSAMLLEAASRAKQMAAEGLDVAILTGADTACVLAGRRHCHADGPAAASASNVVFVPRLDLDPATAAAMGRAEAMLFTEFKLVEQTAFWEIWLRHGAVMPRHLTSSSAAVFYR